MTATDFAAQIGSIRAEIAPALPRNVEPRTVELAAFSAVGQRELGLRIWKDAREAAADAQRSMRRRIRERHGARNPNGWPLMTLLLGAICAAVAAVLTSGFRFDPVETQTAVLVLAGIAAATCILIMIVARGRAMNRAIIRIHAIATIGLVAAAALTVGRGGDTAIILSVFAAIGIIGIVVVFVSRARNAADTETVDTALNVGLAETQPEIEAVSLRMTSEATAELSEADARRIVELRTAVLADLASEGIVLDPVDPTVPAGGVIIESLIATWVPEAMRGEI